MTLLRLAGFTSVRVTSQWQGTEAAPSEAELTRPAERRRRRTALRRPRLPLDLSDGLARDAADARGARAVRRLRDVPQAAAAVDQGRDHRQRAEHQPLLAAAVQPERHRRRRTGIPRPARALLRRASRRSTRPRASGAARSRRGASTAPAPVATRTRRSRSSRTWASPTGRAAGRSADHGRARLPSLRRHLGPVAGHPPPQLDHDRPRRLRPPDADASRPRSTARRRPARCCRSSTTSSGSSRRSRRARRRPTPAPSRRRRSPSTRSPRARTTRRRCSSPSASRT